MTTASALWNSAGRFGLEVRDLGWPDINQIGVNIVAKIACAFEEVGVSLAHFFLPPLAARADDFPVLSVNSLKNADALKSPLSRSRGQRSLYINDAR